VMAAFEKEPQKFKRLLFLCFPKKSEFLYMFDSLSLSSPTNET